MIFFTPVLILALLQAPQPPRLVPAAPLDDQAKVERREAEEEERSATTAAKPPPRRAPDPGIQAQADGRIVRPPVWRRRPTPAEIQEAFPAAALADGVGGVANLVCEIEPDSTLSHCTSPDPKEGYGFGAAALSLAASFRIRPETIDGDPVVRGRVVLPIRFDPPGEDIPEKVQWTASPTTVEVQGALPRPGGRPVTESGRGVMRCTVSGGVLGDCRPAGDQTDPFNRAAVKLASRFALMPTFTGGRPTEGAIINVPVAFDAPGVRPPPPALANPVRFIHAPTNAERNALFPQAAKAHGVTTLTVSETCVVAPDGSLTRCRATKEDPVGLGGAEAATRLVNAFQLPTWSSDGRPVAGAPVNIDIVWAPPSPAEPRGNGVVQPTAAAPLGPTPKSSGRRR